MKLSRLPVIFLMQGVLGASALIGSPATANAQLCDPSPRVGCRAALKAILKISMSGGSSQLTWKWLNGSATTFPEWGSPTTNTDYYLCLYDGLGSLVDREDFFMAVNWQAKPTKGYDWSSPSNEGVHKAKLKSGVEDRAKILVKLKDHYAMLLPTSELAAKVGMFGPIPSVYPSGQMPTPVTVQMVTDDTPTCFESVFDSADVIKNSFGAGQFGFKAKSQ